MGDADIGKGRQYTPRQEARVLGLDELTAQQRDAAAQVHGLLRRYLARPHAKSPAPTGMRHFTPRIDEARWNQNLLLDGDRGSGKTSLLVTMLALWSASLLGDPLTDDQRAMREAWGMTAEPWRVVPLGIVDLQPLPEHTPVLLHLCETLVRVVEALEARDPAEAPPPWLAPEHVVPASRRRWSELVRALVAGWDYAADARWQRLDAETAELEIDRAVRGHQALVGAFHAFLDALVEDFTRWRGWRDPPLFVLPIDDADMKPDRAEELLEALRMLGHPRLVFLLTGESDLFYRIAEERVARTLRSPRGRAPVADDSPVRDRLALELARRIYDKIIPPSHRCAIPGVAPEDRARHLPTLAAMKAPSTTHEGHEVSLAAILSEPVVQGGLPKHVRALRDLELLAAQHAHDPDRAVAEAVLHVWQEAVRDEPVDAWPRGHLESRVERATGRLPFVVRGLEPPPEWQEEGTWTPRGEPATLGEHTLTLSLRSPTLVRAVAGKERVEVPARVVGALLLADVVAFERGGPQAHEPSQRQGLSPVFAQSALAHPQHRAPLAFGWPRPRSINPRGLVHVALRWRRAVEASALPVEALARWYLAVVAQLVTVREPGFEPLPLGPVALERVPSWSEVARRVLYVVHLERSLSPQEEALREWALGRAALLAAPESGLDAASAGQLLDAMQAAAGRQWGELRKHSEVARRERLLAAMKEASAAPPSTADQQGLVKELDAAAGSDHPWFRHIHKSTAPKSHAST